MHVCLTLLGETVSEHWGLTHRCEMLTSQELEPAAGQCAQAVAMLCSCGPVLPPAEVVAHVRLVGAKGHVGRGNTAEVHDGF